jgi:acyl CoA:acetate/3-ketoacid CoA transferase beta subunit
MSQTKGELILTEIFPGVTVDEIRAKTDADFREAKGGLKVVQL